MDGSSDTNPAPSDTSLAIIQIAQADDQRQHRHNDDGGACRFPPDFNFSVRNAPEVGYHGNDQPTTKSMKNPNSLGSAKSPAAKNHRRKQIQYRLNILR